VTIRIRLLLLGLIIKSGLVNASPAGLCQCRFPHVQNVLYYCDGHVSAQAGYLSYCDPCAERDKGWHSHAAHQTVLPSGRQQRR
jgi:hypothetical protein